MVFSAQGRRELIVCLALVLLATGAFAQSRSEPVDPGAWNERLEIGPVEGLTTVWHKAPRSTAVPLGTSVELRVRAPQSAAVVWSGAREVRRNTGFTVAEARFDRPGPQTVQVKISGLTEEDLVETVHFEVVDLGEQPVQVTDLRLTADQVVLDPERPNASSMQYFFRDGSIAKLTENAPGSYVTSTERWVTAAAQVEPAGFAPLVEWRLDGKPLAQLGAQVQLQSFVAREHVLEAGGEELTLETYRVHITSHESRTQIPDGVPVTFAAKTEPPGYESRVTWLASTKTGTCTPARGEGAEFTVLFDGTVGSQGRWLGVRADGTSVATDEKPGNSADLQECLAQRGLDSAICTSLFLDLVSEQSGDVRRCAQGSRQGESCDTNADCTGTCLAGFFEGEECSSNFDCNTLGDAGTKFCEKSPHQQCNNKSDCGHKTCSNNPAKSCQVDQDCDIPNRCSGGSNPGIICTTDSDCGGLCAVLGTPCSSNNDCKEPAFCSGGIDAGDSCTSLSDCREGCVGGVFDGQPNDCLLNGGKCHTNVCKGGNFNGSDCNQIGVTTCVTGGGICNLEGVCVHASGCVEKQHQCQFGDCGGGSFSATCRSNLCVERFFHCIDRGFCVQEGEDEFDRFSIPLP